MGESKLKSKCWYVETNHFYLYFYCQQKLNILPREAEILVFV